jgi:hypothetical protein
MQRELFINEPRIHATLLADMTSNAMAKDAAREQ